MQIVSALLCLLFFVINYWQGQAQSNTAAAQKRQHAQSKPLLAQDIPKDKFFTIYGKFSNYNQPVDSLRFCRVVCQSIHNARSEYLMIAAIDSTGHFRFRFPLLHSQEISIEFGNSTQWIYAKAGDSLYVQLDHGQR
jgi:hypothetical protein